MLLAGSSEQGRYFLIAHRQHDDMDEIDYLRTIKPTQNPALSDPTLTYGRMQLNCGADQVRKYTAERLEALDTADLGRWYTPTPNSTDSDMYNFICEHRAPIATPTSTINTTPTTPTTSVKTAEPSPTKATAQPTEPQVVNEVPSYPQPEQQATPSSPPPQADKPAKHAAEPPTVQVTAPPIHEKPAKPEKLEKPENLEKPAPVTLPKAKTTQPLEAQKQNYTNQISDIIKSNWKLPMAPKFHSVRATFSIAPNGRITNIQVHTDDVYAQSTLSQAIQSSSPLPPVPLGLEDEFAYNRMTFTIE